MVLSLKGGSRDPSFPVLRGGVQNTKRVVRRRLPVNLFVPRQTVIYNEDSPGFAS